MSYYIDSSAIIKLILLEPESLALRRFLSDQSISSSIARLEVLRTIDRLGGDLTAAARERLSSLSYVELDPAVLSIAESFRQYPTLRSLDAIHLASAILIREHIDGVITYDKGMAACATAMGLKVFAPE